MHAPLNSRLSWHRKVARNVFRAARMTNLSRPALILTAASALAACVPAPGPAVDDDEAPLSSYDSLLEGAPENRSIPREGKADAVYPPTFTELVADQSPVKSQGSRGVCSIFSTVALMENLYIKAGAPRDFSEQYLQWSVKNEVRAFTKTEGSNARENLQAISRFGIPEETAWPYEPFPWGAFDDPECGGDASGKPTKCYTNGDPPESARTAQKYKLPAGKWLNNRDIKHHLTTKQHGVIVGLDFFYQAWNHRKSTLPRSQTLWEQGYVTYPNAKDIEESHKQRAGHSILIVGWDDEREAPVRDADGNEVKNEDGSTKMEKGFFLFKNSWGTSGFGIRNEHGAGYGWLSMKYVADYGSTYVSDLPRVQPPTPQPGPDAERFEAKPGAPIPDNDLTGITSDLEVTSAGTVTELSVEVDITHTYVGDLTVRLTHDGKTVTLQAQQGGSDDDLKKVFRVTDFANAAKQGTWSLVVVDGARYDVGTLDRWALVIR